MILLGSVWDEIPSRKYLDVKRSGSSSAALPSRFCFLSHHGVGTSLHRPLEVAVDRGLHRREEERGPETADDRPEDDDREQALRERHRQRADRISEQAEDVRALAAVSRSCTTAEIETFISDVSTTSTKIAIASRIATSWLPPDSSCATAVDPVLIRATLSAARARRISRSERGSDRVAAREAGDQS